MSQQHLEVMAGGRVAVQVQAAGGLEHTAQLHQARRHHSQVRHHVAAAQDEVKARRASATGPPFPPLLRRCAPQSRPIAMVSS